MAFQVAAQDESGDNAPQVLTSDLASRQEIQEDTLKVTFVLVDDDQITKVTIDGKAEVFQPADTVSIVKTFRFTRGVRTITVEVQDEKGNRRAKKYVVAFGVPLPEQKAAGDEKPALSMTYIVEASTKTDSNPALDWSIPFGLTPADLGVDPGAAGTELTVEGQIPDADQTDNRTTLSALAAGTYGSITGFGGFLSASYSKDFYEGLKSQVIFLGGQYKFAKPQETGFFAGLTWMDINLGGTDYSQNLLLAGGLDSRSKDKKGNKLKKVLGLDLTSKSFAPPSDGAAAAKTSGTRYGLKYDSGSRDAENLDTSRHVTALGTNTEGNAETDYTFLRYRAAWENRWDFGLRVDVGWGIRYRDYINVSGGRQDIGSDILVGMGWQFTPGISAMYTYRSAVNISLVSPYDKTVTGITVKGTF